MTNRRESALLIRPAGAPHGGSHESVSLTDSTLALWSAETTLTELRPAGNFRLKNSTLTTYGQFRGAANYVVEQPVQLDRGSNTISTGRW
jgi:hypothetical protein